MSIMKDFAKTVAEIYNHIYMSNKYEAEMVKAIMSK